MNFSNKNQLRSLIRTHLNVYEIEKDVCYQYVLISCLELRYRNFAIINTVTRNRLLQLLHIIKARASAPINNVWGPHWDNNFLNGSSNERHRQIKTSAKRKGSGKNIKKVQFYWNCYSVQWNTYVVYVLVHYIASTENNMLTIKNYNIKFSKLLKRLISRFL